MDYSISKRGEACAGCENPYVHGDEVTSTLFLEGDEWSRSDYCPECFGKQEKKWFSSWRSIFHPPPPRPKKPDRQLIWEFFQNLGEDEPGKKRIFRYVLGLYLMRRKFVKLQGHRNDENGQHMLLTGPDGEKVPDVAVVALTESDADEALEMVEQVLLGQSTPV